MKNVIHKYIIKPHRKHIFEKQKDLLDVFINELSKNNDVNYNIEKNKNVCPFPVYCFEIKINKNDKLLFKILLFLNEIKIESDIEIDTVVV
jgi:hypothetical protein